MRSSLNRRLIRTIPLVIVPLLTLLLLLPRPSLSAAQDTSVTTIFLVRHAEKVPDGSADPALTEGGHQRALALADLLEDTGQREILILCLLDHLSDLRATSRSARSMKAAGGIT